MPEARHERKLRLLVVHAAPHQRRRLNILLVVDDVHPVRAGLDVAAVEQEAAEKFVGAVDGRVEHFERAEPMRSQRGNGFVVDGEVVEILKGGVRGEEDARLVLVLIPVRVLVFGYGVRTPRDSLVCGVQPVGGGVVGRKRAALPHARAFAHERAWVAEVEVVRHVAAGFGAQHVDVGADYAVVLVERRFHADFIAHDVLAELLHFARGVEHELRNVHGVSMLFDIERAHFRKALERRFPSLVERVDFPVFFLRPFLERGVSESPALCGHAVVEGKKGVKLVEVFDCRD